MSDRDKWDNSELATEEDSELDDVNDETFGGAVDVDYAWEEEHQQAASQLEEEKRQQRVSQSFTVDLSDKLGMLSLQPQVSQRVSVATPSKVGYSTATGSKEVLYSKDSWDTSRFESSRNDTRQLPTSWDAESRGRPKKVLFAQDLERSLLEETSQRVYASDHISRVLLGPRTERRNEVDKGFSTESYESNVFQTKSPWGTLSETSKLDTEYPTLESTKTRQGNNNKKKAISSVQSSSSSSSNSNFWHTKNASNEQRPKRTNYHKGGGGRQFVRRLSSKWMTSSEIELIAKMHIRQLETSNWPEEDFYCQTYQRKLQKKTEEQVKEHPYSRDKRRTQKSGYFPHHSENNLKILKRALGSIQGYNPNAPRRIVQVSSDSISDSFLEKEEIHLTDTTPFHEDSRIAAQSVISSAFDTLFDLEDASSIHSSTMELEEYKDRMSRKLLSIFGISEEEEELSDETRNIFSRVCSLSKGRKLLVRCFAVLSRTYVISLLNMILFSLGMILKRMNKSQLEDPSWEQFSDIVIHCIEDMEDSCVITEWTHSFVVGHRDDKTFLYVATTGSSLSMIISLLFNASSLDFSNNLPLKSLLNILCERLILCVEEMFQHVEHSIVWQLIALLDGLVEANLREKLRMIIKKLIEEQRVTLST